MTLNFRPRKPRTLKGSGPRSLHFHNASTHRYVPYPMTVAFGKDCAKFYILLTVHLVTNSC